MRLMRWALAWLLFGIGHLASKLLGALPESEGWEWVIDFLYPLYNWPMLWSSSVQGERDFGPWSRPRGKSGAAQ